MKENSAHGFTEGSEVPKEQEVPQKDANLCPVMDHYYCFNRACGINHEKQCLMINPKDKIYVDGSKVGDYIQQHIAFRREMEMNYAKMQGELTRLRSELAQAEERLEGKTKKINSLCKSLQDKNLELQQKDEVIVLAYDALSVIRTEPTMSGSVIAGFDRKKFLELRYKFFEFVNTHTEIELSIAKSKAK